MKKLTSIQLQIDPSVVELIDKQCGGPSYGGKRGGRAHFIRKILYKALDVPLDAGWLGRGPEKDLVGIDEKFLATKDPICAEVVRLVKQGLSYRDIAHYMKSERVPTPRNGTWTYQTVRGYIKKAHKLCS